MFKSFSVQKLSACDGFWIEKLRDKVRRASIRWGRSSSARMRWNSWDGLRWPEDMGWDEMKRDEIRWSAKCEVWSAECEECIAKCEAYNLRNANCDLWRRIATEWCAGRVLGQQQRDRLAGSTRTGLGRARACKFYRWKRSYFITSRQLPPRLVRAPRMKLNKKNGTGLYGK